MTERYGGSRKIDGLPSVFIYPAMSKTRRSAAVRLQQLVRPSFFSSLWFEFRMACVARPRLPQPGFSPVLG